VGKRESENVKMRPFVFFAAVQYENCLSGRTRGMAEALAAMGHDITFVEMPATRVAVRHFFRNGYSRLNDSPVRILRLLPLPGYLHLYRSRLANQWIRRVRGVLEKKIPNLDDAVVIASTPWWFPVVEKMSRGLLFYDYIDHITVHASRRSREAYSHWDRELLACCDMVTTVSEYLRESLAARVGNQRVTMIPNGVSADWIKSPPQSISRNVLARRSEKIIAGFLGALFEWVDLKLLAKAAQSLEDVEFVIVGPKRWGTRLRPLRKMPNMRVFGPQPHTQVPRWIGGFDICLVPFHQGVISDAADPIKIYEYSAMGKPIVSTIGVGTTGSAVRITVARSHDEFIRGIPLAAHSDSPAKKAERIEFARANTWHQRAKHLADTVEHFTAPVRRAQADSFPET